MFKLQNFMHRDLKRSWLHNFHFYATSLWVTALGDMKYGESKIHR